MIEKQEFEQIFRRHYDGMFRLARRMLGDDAESKDVVSDVFAQLLNKVRCGEFEIRNAETLQAYLLTSVRNRCINLLVHRQKDKQRADELYSEIAQEQKAVIVEMSNPGQTAEQEQLQTLHRYVDRHLPKLSQQILRLRYQQGLKYREIANVLQVSEVTVHNHLSQSLKQLKDHFKSLGYGIK
ncbi:MAG: sigma-70 family RNA polymerase sigma factor [Prevotella sp.]|nr:sigma-70 family RNA polymerase sigma factor [Prevotella sp.]